MTPKRCARTISGTGSGEAYPNARTSAGLADYRIEEAGRYGVKILSLISSLSQGGAQSVLVDLVTGLTEHEHVVVHFTSRKGVEPHAPFVRNLTDVGAPCIDAPWGSLDDEAGRRAVLGRFEPDAVLCHWWGHDPWLRWIRETSARPSRFRPAFVCVMHHFGVPATAGYDRYVLVTNAQLPQCRARPRERVRVISNGVDLSRFDGNSRVRRAGEELTVGRLSCLRPGKIPEDWIATADSYELPETRFVIGGAGELMPKLLAQTKQVPRPERFSLPGYVPRERVPDFLAGLDVFCYVTAEAVECHPLALIEAQASGLPIVAEAKGGVPGIVRHNESGLLVGSKSEVGKQLHRLRQEPTLLERLSQGALESAKRFSLDRQLGAYRAVLAGLERSAPGEVCA